MIYLTGHAARRTIYGPSLRRTLTLLDRTRVVPGVGGLINRVGVICRVAHTPTVDRIYAENPNLVASLTNFRTARGPEFVS